MIPDPDPGCLERQSRIRVSTTRIRNPAGKWYD